MTETKEDSLKQLNFVPEYGSKGYTIASNVYENAKTYAPEPVKETLENLEQKTAPYIHRATDTGSQILKKVDSKVDQAVQNAQKTYTQQKAYHAQNLEKYKAAREQYLKKVEDVVSFVKVKGLNGAAKVAVEDLSIAIKEARKIPGSLAKKVHDAFEKMMSLESVQKVLKGTQQPVQMAYKTYQQVHDSVVASSSYKKLYDISATTVSQVQTSFIYRKAAENLYPLVAKYADPMYERLDPSMKALMMHVQPATVESN